MGTVQEPVLAVTIAIFSFASIFVSLYMISAVFVVRKISLADYLMLLAWMLDLGFVFSLLYAVRNGLGLHDDDIKPENRIVVNKSVYVFNILYHLTSIAAKCSILIFFLSLTHQKKLFYRANYFLLFIVTSVGLALAIHQVFQCHPVSAVFHLETQTTERCSNLLVTSLASSPYNISTDIAILVIPIPLLTRIRLPFRQRLILVALFNAGILVIVFDVTRIGHLEGIAKQRLSEMRSYRTSEIGNEDYTWYAALALMWSAVEVNTTIICACVPSLKPVTARITPALIFNPHETALFRSRENKVKPAEQNADEINHGGMMGILTSGSRPRPHADEEEEKYPAEITDEYPHNIKLLNLLNLRPRRVLRLNAKQSIAPNILVITIFFLWGFGYGYITVLGERIGVRQVGRLRVDLLLGAYFIGYLFGPTLVGQIILKRLGFSAGFIAGLYIVALGNILFWTSAILISVPSAGVANSITGVGLGILEATANLFISICGPLEYSEVRLCIAQAFQGIGGLLSRLVVGKLLLPSTMITIDGFLRLQWSYLCIAFADVLLALIFYYLPVPEAPPEDLKELAQRRPTANNASIFGVPVVYVTLILGVWSIFFYIAGQEAFVGGFADYLQRILPRSKLDDLDLTDIGSTLYTVSRFAAAWIQYMGFKPRWVLLISYIGTIIVSLICMETLGVTSLAFSLLIWFIEAPIYPISFAIALRGTGRHAKTAGSFLATGVGSATFAYVVRYLVQLKVGDPASNVIVVAFFSAGAIFPLYLNLVPAAKRQVDPIKDEYVH